MKKSWFCNLGDQIKFLALWSTIVSELCDEGGLFLDCNEIVNDVLTISRISQIQSWLQYYEEVDYSKLDELENAHKASARICKRKRELLSSLNNATE